MRQRTSNQKSGGPAGVRRARRAKQVALGTAGLVVLGAGAYVTTDKITQNGRSEVRNVTALAPAEPPEPSSSDPASAPSAAVSEVGKDGALPSAHSLPNSAKSVAPAIPSELAAIRDKARKAPHVVVKRAPARAGEAWATDAEVHEITHGSPKSKKGTIKVVSARLDLTGQRELSWIVDEGEPVGDAHCSQRFRIMAGGPVAVKPTLLVCWRTGKTKSVYTVAINMLEKPSRKASVAAISKEWARLG